MDPAEFSIFYSNMKHFYIFTKICYFVGEKIEISHLVMTFTEIFPTIRGIFTLYTLLSEHNFPVMDFNWSAIQNPTPDFSFFYSYT